MPTNRNNSNFWFLAEHDERLAKLDRKAELLSNILGTILNPEQPTTSIQL